MDGKRGVPRGSVPGWLAWPLDAKFPAMTGNEMQFFTTDLGERVWIWTLNFEINGSLHWSAWNAIWQNSPRDCPCPRSLWAKHQCDSTPCCAQAPTKSNKQNSHSSCNQRPPPGVVGLQSCAGWAGEPSTTSGQGSLAAILVSPFCWMWVQNCKFGRFLCWKESSWSRWCRIFHNKEHKTFFSYAVVPEYPDMKVGHSLKSSLSAKQIEQWCLKTEFGTFWQKAQNAFCEWNLFPI